ncbi:SIS domain-containing protein [Lysinibacter cavernae]|uniref:Fructoselysine-6-P-deglycase FrlB-like protein n=1 Tax=Lysinibacter cavernae TaxID=1640652 RepID=A0A7X5R1B5_9MICO|nr:sugar isomerase [Lysinibacter cavernae]NIH53823.1 fructoselysine-6-P-deglycase FrlB-like protein [Lysinibacter cavernae]
MSTNSVTEQPGQFMAAELASQPAMWRKAVELAGTVTAFPQAGERVAIVGCGTSWFMGQAYASLRESLGHGVTDAFTATEFPRTRDYDVLILLTRSGTTSEVLELLGEEHGGKRTLGIVGDPTTSFSGLVDDVIELPFADEQSVVQTRFATSALALLRTSLGENLDAAIADAEAALAEDLDDSIVLAEQFSFLGRGWALGLATEAALKMREAAQSWTESYQSMEYRHGPIAIAAPGRVTWQFGEAPDGLANDVAATGATFVTSALDPLADLVRVHRVALARALSFGLNPDHPRNLTRSVVLEG